MFEHGFGDMAVSGFVPVNIPFDEVLGVYGLGRLAADEFREEVKETDAVVLRKCPPERDRDAFQVVAGELIRRRINRDGQRDSVLGAKFLEFRHVLPAQGQSLPAPFIPCRLLVGPEESVLLRLGAPQVLLQVLHPEPGIGGAFEWEGVADGLLAVQVQDGRTITIEEGMPLEESASGSAGRTRRRFRSPVPSTCR